MPDNDALLKKIDKLMNETTLVMVCAAEAKVVIKLRRFTRVFQGGLLGVQIGLAIWYFVGREWLEVAISLVCALVPFWFLDQNERESTRRLRILRTEAEAARRRIDWIAKQL